MQGLEAGMTINEIKEILVQTYAYAGFPRSLRALQTFMSVLDNRKKAGIEISYTDDEMRRIDEALGKIVIHGDRYNANNQSHIGK